MIKACIFDLDGTLVDSIEDIAAACNYALEQFGFPSETPQAIQSYFGDGIAKVIERSMPAEARSEDNITKVKEAMLKYYSDHLTVYTKPFVGITQMLQGLLAMKIRWIVLSNKAQDQTMGIVHGLFGKNLFEKISGLRSGVLRKPDPRETLRCIEDAGLKTYECLFIGDSPGDMITAKKAGIKPVGVAWGYFPEETLIRKGADMILQSPAELLDYLGFVNGTKPVV